MTGAAQKFAHAHMRKTKVAYEYSNDGATKIANVSSEVCAIMFRQACIA